MTPIQYAYIAQRRKGVPAIAAMEQARLKPSPHGGYPSFTIHGNITRQLDRPHYAWIEDADEAGLRFVGYADKLAQLDHTGWYTDEDGGNGQSYRGAVWRLPHTRGLIAGYTDPNNDGAAFVELSIVDPDDETGAAYAADRIAELEAETAREYNAAWQAGRHYEDLAEEIATARRECLALIRETKRACTWLKSDATDYQALRSTIHAKVRSFVRDIAAARSKREELAQAYGTAAGFKDA